MNFINAVEIAERNSHLIGMSYNGGIIDEIVIVPTNLIEFQNFKTEYIKTLNPQRSIASYMESDVEIFAIIDKKRIRTENVFLTISLNQLDDNFNVQSGRI